MIKIFMVRHAQPQRGWLEERTRPLTAEGRSDARLVTRFLSERRIDAFYSSPYRRAIETIEGAAAFFNMEIQTDEDLREIVKGPSGDRNAFPIWWEDPSHHNQDGESLAMLEARNIAALRKILRDCQTVVDDVSVVVGTHGMALSAILRYYDPSFGCEDFFRFMDWMPYSIELDFEGELLVGKREHLFVKKAK